MFNTIEEYLFNIGNDLSLCKLDNVDLSNSDLTNVILPDDPALFQKIKQKSLFKTKLPDMDYSKWDFGGVVLTSCAFHSNSKLPSNPNLFQTIHQKDLFGTMLPDINMNDYMFCNVKLARTIFSKKTIMSTDVNIFQKIHNKSLYGTILPPCDFSNHKFDDVCLVGTTFSDDSIFSKKYNVFQNILDKSILGCKLPQETVSNIVLYNLDEVEVDWNDFKINIIDLQRIYLHYKNNKSMIFPKTSISSVRKGMEIKLG